MRWYIIDRFINHRAKAKTTRTWLEPERVEEEKGNETKWGMQKAKKKRIELKKKMRSKSACFDNLWLKMFSTISFFFFLSTPLAPYFIYIYFSFGCIEWKNRKEQKNLCLYNLTEKATSNKQCLCLSFSVYIYIFFYLISLS